MTSSWKPSGRTGPTALDATRSVTRDFVTYVLRELPGDDIPPAYTRILRQTMPGLHEEDGGAVA